ncbi:MAG: DUF6145 family protein [Eubacterium sp.]
MCEEKNILCVANSYDRKYYLNDAFNRLPTQIKEELQIMCVMFTEEVGGILILKYDDDGNLQFETRYDEGDLLYDEIGSELKIRQLQVTKKELLEGLEMYHKVLSDRI